MTEGRAGQHLLIAGTGRAGTTFLVRWLTALGLDTEQSRHGEAGYYETAQAGLETLPLSIASADRPYVLKSPLAGLMVDDVLADPLIALDAVVVPMRDLADAANSRIVSELAALHREVPWLSTLRRTWDQRWFTPGGALFSTDPSTKRDCWRSSSTTSSNGSLPPTCRWFCWRFPAWWTTPTTCLGGWPPCCRESRRHKQRRRIRRSLSLRGSGWGVRTTTASRLPTTPRCAVN